MATLYEVACYIGSTMSHHHHSIFGMRDGYIQYLGRRLHGRSKSGHDFRPRNDFFVSVADQNSPAFFEQKISRKLSHHNSPIRKPSQMLVIFDAIFNVHLSFFFARTTCSMRPRDGYVEATWLFCWAHNLENPFWCNIRKNFIETQAVCWGIFCMGFRWDMLWVWVAVGRLDII